MYRFKGIELTPKIFRELLIEKFDGKQFSRADAIKEIEEYHLENGGLCDKNEYVSVFKKASLTLRENGMINCGYGIWRLNYNKKVTKILQQPIPIAKVKVDEEYGNGKDSVYLYYYEAYRELAKLKNTDFFPCKIGRSDKDPLHRVLSQGGTCFPEKPHIALLFHCNNASYLESALHSILKMKGKWICKAPGTEWFNTNVDEIKELYFSIIGAKA